MVSRTQQNRTTYKLQRRCEFRGSHLAMKFCAKNQCYVGKLANPFFNVGLRNHAMKSHSCQYDNWCVQRGMAVGHSCQYLSKTQPKQFITTVQNLHHEISFHPYVGTEKIVGRGAYVGTEKNIGRGGPKFLTGWGVKIWLQGGGQLHGTGRG